MASYERREYPCGCYYEKTEAPTGELLALRLLTCSVCMDATLLTLDNLMLDEKAQLTLGLASDTSRAEVRSE